MPCREGQSFIKLAQNNALFCSRKTYINPKPNKKPKRLLLEFTPQKTEPEEYVMTIEKGGRNDFTEEYRALTQDFYLYF
ncbi:MAG: hypothetical protein ACOCTU_03160 [Bacteroidota bacterium]